MFKEDKYSFKIDISILFYFKVTQDLFENRCDKTCGNMEVTVMKEEVFIFTDS